MVRELCAVASRGGVGRALCSSNTPLLQELTTAWFQKSAVAGLTLLVVPVMHGPLQIMCEMLGYSSGRTVGARRMRYHRPRTHRLPWAQPVQAETLHLLCQLLNVPCWKMSVPAMVYAMRAPSS